MNEQWRRDDLVDAVTDYAICGVDLSGHIQSWNVGAERILGYSAEEALGRHIAAFYPTPARQSKGPEGALREALSRGRSTEDGWLVRRDGTSFWASWVLTRRQDSSAEPAGFALVVMDLTPRRQADEQTRRAARMNDRIEIAQRVRTCTIGELFRITLTLQSLASEASGLPRERMERLISDIDDVILNLRKHILQTSSGRGGVASSSMPGGQSKVRSGDRWLIQGPPRLQGVGRRDGAHPDSW